MNIEQPYQPSDEEMELAEENLTPEQKLQSDAHEEGYNLGAEKNKQILYFEPIESITEQSLEQKITLHIPYREANVLKIALNELCIQNDVECKILEGVLDDFNRVKMEINFMGTKQNILKVIEGLKRIIR